MDVTGKEYQQMNKQVAPKSPVAVNCVKAFLIGGLLCTLEELIAQLNARRGWRKSWRG